MSKELGKDYEALVEDYEDALMRLVMYQAAQEDSGRLLKEAEELERSGLEVPRELDEKCRKLIQAGCPPVEDSRGSAEARPRKKSSARPLALGKIGKILAAAILASVLLFCAAYAANEQFRIDVLNFFLELQENGTWFSFGSGESGGVQPNQPGASAADGEFPFEFTYIPDGYELFIQEVRALGDGGTEFYSRYHRPDDQYRNFFFEIRTLSEGMGMLVDTEDAIVTNATIYGQDGYIITKNEPLYDRRCVTYLWFNMEKQYSYGFYSIGISDKEAKYIFDNIVIDEHFL